jgi:heat shock protein HslJ
VGAASLVLLLAGCGGGSEVAQTGSEDAPHGTWLSTSVREAGPAKALVQGHRFSLQFHDDGRLSASGDCNTSSGTVRFADGRMTVGDLGTTAMGCPGAGRQERDAWLAAFLAAGPAYTYDGERLDLSTSTAAMALEPREVVEPDRALEGTRWRIDTVTAGPPPGAGDDPNGSVSAGAVPGAGGALVLTAGRVRGTVDCVAFEGPAAVTDGAVTFGDLTVDRSGCRASARTVADPVLAVLAGEVAASVDAAVLHLTHPSGRGLDLHADTAPGA